ncbi:MAG: Tic20 family protein [Snowella sp.]|nr:Tic20 family protein [Snowella sp.]
MTSRGSTDPKDRIFGALVYIIPLLDALQFGKFLINQFPPLALIYLPLQPLINIYYGFPFASFIIFLLLFFAIVRNEKISHFIRFNAMQCILIGILLALFGLIVQTIFPGLGVNLLTETLFNVAFLGALAACGYSIIQSVMGRYAEIPTISEAAYSQVRW